MNYEIKVFRAFISAMISTIVVYLGGVSISTNSEPWIFLALFVIGFLFIRPIWALLKSFNVYTWLILTSYIVGIVAIEWGNMRLAFEGLFMTFPLILFYLYWSQKNSLFLATKETVSRKYLFYIDVFLISSAFLIAGLFMLLLDFNNTDLRGWWPFVITFYTLYGLGSGFVYALIAMPIQQYHWRYTQIYSSALVLILSAGIYLPRHIQIFNGVHLSSFSAVLLAALLLHSVIVSFLWIKQRAWGRSC